ncbi:hypothetical protein Taro_025954, partial [Colocasia esculenta]|nr:hypothetical protein [Colocasia esculenta]
MWLLRYPVSFFVSAVLLPLLLEFRLLWLVRDWLSLLSLLREAHPPTLFRVFGSVGGDATFGVSGGDPKGRVVTVVRDVGACVMRLWSQVVAPVFCELLCLGGSMTRVASALCLTPLVLRESCRDSLSQEFVAGRLWWRFVQECEREHLYRSESRVALLQVLE